MATDQSSYEVDNGTIYCGLTTETGDSIPKFDSAFNCLKSPKTANNSDRRQRKLRVKRRGAGLFSIALLAAVLHPGPAYAGEDEAVSEWNQRAIAAIVNGTAATTPGVQFPPPSAFIHRRVVPHRCPAGAVWCRVQPNCHSGRRCKRCRSQAGHSKSFQTQRPCSSPNRVRWKRRS